VFAVYATFLQRGYDMLLHDVALMKSGCVFAIDRAGLVPGDGETHQGVYDIPYLSAVPGREVYAPASFAELEDVLAMAVRNPTNPVAIRYPKGGEGYYKDGGVELSKILRVGADITLVTYGILTNVALDASETLAEEDISVEVIKLLRVVPIDFSHIAPSVEKTRRVIVLEDCVAAGCVGERVAAELLRRGTRELRVKLLNVGDRQLPCATVAELQTLCGIDVDGVVTAARELLHET
jgi:1-deoxy-D-xylulose-5-phosphate synthase